MQQGTDTKQVYHLFQRCLDVIAGFLFYFEPEYDVIFYRKVREEGMILIDNTDVSPGWFETGYLFTS